MAAPKGNKFYMNREKNGRERIFKDSGDLLNKAYEYFEWCNNNPLKRNEVIKGGMSAGAVVKVDTDRPYTLVGLCVHCGISVETFKNYEKLKGFFEVTTHIREIIEQNQIEGACVGQYKENIIARLLGLADKKDINIPTPLTIEVVDKKTKSGIEKLQEKLQES